MTHTSKLIASAILASAMGATSALAAESFTEVDLNADGLITPQELITADPTITEDAFKAADTDGDGALSPEEYEAMAG